MKCVLCNKATSVIDTRNKLQETMRRRECASCNVRFNTMEKVFGKVSSDRTRKVVMKGAFIRSEDDWIERVPRSDYADRIFCKIGR
jgi:transcriptional regulator NrdR family protein